MDINILSEVITDYQAEWPDKFLEESKQIIAALGSDVIDIQHIGSTSIIGMFGKPVIDIAILTKSIKNISAFTERLELLSYSYKEEMSSKERIFLRKGTPVKYYLSITCSDYYFWDRQIKFRDCLNNNPALVEEYIALKKENINKAPTVELKDLSRSKVYNQGKGEFVEKVLRLT